MALYEKLKQASSEYLRRLKMENVSIKTFTNYQFVLQSFIEFVGNTEQTDEFVAVVAWKTKLFESGCAPSTIKQYLVDLQIFFSAASHRSYPQEIRFGENPIDKTLLPKIPERPYETVLTDEQVKMLYRNSPPPHYAPTWARNWCVIQIALNEKLRNAEILDLKLSDIDMYHHIIIVNSGKGRKYREVDMTELTEFAIEQYLASGLRPSYLTDNDYLFGTEAAHEYGRTDCLTKKERWHRGSTEWLSNMIERTVKAITGVSQCRSHDLRHVGSRVCLNAGQSIEQLQGQLGHSQITTTQIYTRRMGSRRSRDSAKSVLAERAAITEQLKRKNIAEQQVILLFA